MLCFRSSSQESRLLGVRRRLFAGHTASRIVDSPHPWHLHRQSASPPGARRSSSSPPSRQRLLPLGPELAGMAPILGPGIQRDWDDVQSSPDVFGGSMDESLGNDGVLHLSSTPVVPAAVDSASPGDTGPGQDLLEYGDSDNGHWGLGPQLDSTSVSGTSPQPPRLAGNNFLIPHIDSYLTHFPCCRSRPQRASPGARDQRHCPVGPGQPHLARPPSGRRRRLPLLLWLLCPFPLGCPPHCPRDHIRGWRAGPRRGAGLLHPLRLPQAGPHPAQPLLCLPGRRCRGQACRELRPSDLGERQEGISCQTSALLPGPGPQIFSFKF